MSKNQSKVLLDSANQSLRDGDLEEAIHLALESYELYGGPGAPYILGHSFLLLENKDKAIEWYKLASKDIEHDDNSMNEARNIACFNLAEFYKDILLSRINGEEDKYNIGVHETLDLYKRSMKSSNEQLKNVASKSYTIVDTAHPFKWD
jgi:hypothetical protein